LKQGKFVSPYTNHHNLHTQEIIYNTPCNIYYGIILMLKCVYPRDISILSVFIQASVDKGH